MQLVGVLLLGVEPACPRMIVALAEQYLPFGDEEGASPRNAWLERARRYLAGTSR